MQSFDPIPLYEVMEGPGFEPNTEQKGEAEYHASFCRTDVKQEEKDIPMRPAALTGMPLIDENPGNPAVNFRNPTRNDGHRHLPYEIRLLLSLTSAVGAGRMRQATLEPVKACIHGLDSAAPDDVFELPVRNQGFGCFSSEIGLSALFAACRTVRHMEKQGRQRSESVICSRKSSGKTIPA